MKTLLIIDANLSQARAYIARTLPEAAAQKAHLEIIDDPNDTELAIVLSDTLPADNSLNGKKVWLNGIGRAVARPEFFFNEAKDHAKPYSVPVTTASVASSDPERVVAVMTCSTGVAHTSMAAEAIETEAREHGQWVEVETRGSVGAGNAIIPEEVAQADLMIVAVDTEVDLTKFADKPMYHTSADLALKRTKQELDKALREAIPYQPTGRTQTSATENGKESAGAYRHLLTGVSYMLPMAVAGGLCITLSSAFGIEAFKEQGTLAATLIQIGGDSAFALMVPILAGYIAFSITDRPGLTSGLIGGILAVSTGSGLTDGIIAGFLTSYVARLISAKLKLPQGMKALKPILIIPLFSSLVISLAMICLIGRPVVGIPGGLTYWLQTMDTANAVLLGAILGGVMCTDIGGPVSKAAYTFSVGLLSTQTYAPMAAIMATSMIPPLALGLATLVARHKFDKAQQEGGKAALALGLCFITEGAIPSAARDLMRVLSCYIVGGVITGIISVAVGVRLMVPHGGLFVLLIPGAIAPVLGYLLTIIAGTLVAGLSYAMLKRPGAEVVAKVA